MNRTISAIVLLSSLALAGCQSTGAIDTAQPTVNTARTNNTNGITVKSAVKQFNQGNFGLAQKTYQKAVEQTPKNGAAWLGLAASYDKLGRFDLADTAYKRLLDLEGRKAAILNNYGYSHILRGNFKKARVLMNEARSRAPLSAIVESNWKLANKG